MRVIGTAGHVDHGKSTLVEKLSGINPDRLAEEQSRQMTIDLGFAWLDLPDGETIGIVDVPGHRDFIENMLAGVGGIDAALLVIAADEGIMPQTREHLAILQLLDIRDIVIVVSKIDLIDDPEWTELVKLEIEDLLSQARLGDLPLITVSAHTGAGIDQLVETLRHLLAELPQRVDYHQPRLPVDRVFAVSGFGTVATGTLSGGTLSIGDNIELQPSGKAGRIRGLQSYRREVEAALPGSRVAVNISGINSAEIQRGDVLTFPGQIRPTLLADAHFTQLSDIERPLAHNAQVKIFCGASESIANVRLLNDDILSPGAKGWLQIRLRDSLPLSRGDRFILRYPSPAETIGGGLIINPHPGRRHKRFQPQIIEELELRLSGSPGERLALAAKADAPQTLDDLQKKLGYSRDELAAALSEALSSGLIRRLDEQRYWASVSWQRLADSIMTALDAYHLANPLRLGMPRPELQSRLNVKLNLLDKVIEDEDRLTFESNFVRMSDHAIRFSSEQDERANRVLQLLAAEAFTPPAIAELNQIAGEEVVRALADLRQIINVNDSIAFAADSYDQLVAEIRNHISEFGEIDAKTLRDKFGASRKYAIAVLEHLDSLGITQRVGDVRMRGRNL
ncbi:MAG: selenocysteine-specific translation elongation factor [Chloroflexota bacterium]|nr:selenocysteine-specific translation elongation factor [Chloroflexota bacterium]